MANMNQPSKHLVNFPKVSVVLPNLNNRRFLTERLDSIVNQILTDWELILVDSYSDDGAWELIQAYAARDRRFHIAQAPRDGIYPNLNRCIAQARGEYVYIATSDDTMKPECLKKMVKALDAHPDCDICHTCLKVIDEKGKQIEPLSWKYYQTAQFYGDLLDKMHIRTAPYDGILHCAVLTVYSSLTQLLIRRSVFEKAGKFETKWGAVGDFEWGMRAGLVCNILHIPETLATWRRHSGQATQEQFIASSAHKAQLCRMIKSALPLLQQNNPNLHKKIRVRRLLFPYRREQLFLGMGELSGKFQKLLLLMSFMFISPKSIIEFLALRIFGMHLGIDKATYIRGELKRMGLEHNVKILDR